MFLNKFLTANGCNLLIFKHLLQKDNITFAVMDSEILIQKIDELTRKVNTLLEANKHDTRSQSEWIDKEETMKILKCSERTLQTLRDNGSLSYTKPLRGSKFFYRRIDIESLFENFFNGKI